MKKFLILLGIALLFSCDFKKLPKKDLGILHFTVNGENFIRKGFTSKDGWQISFSHAWINLANVTAYQFPKSIEDLNYKIPKDCVQAKLPGSHLVDMAKEKENAISIGKVNTLAGIYNGIIFSIQKAQSGYSLVLKGEAKKDRKKILFTLKFDREVQLIGGGYVGDEVKGVVAKDKNAEVEMTFHFDHLFGDATLKQDNSLNKKALGFSPFAKLNKTNIVNINQREMEKKMPKQKYIKLVEIFDGLAHVGEGHCKVKNKRK